MTIKELFDAMQHATAEQNDMAFDVVQDFADTVQKQFPNTYNKYMNRFKEIYHNHNDLTEMEAMDAVSKLKNKDGTTGPHWSVEQVEKTIPSYPELQNCPFWTLYYVLNMIYSDYYNPAFSVKTYILLAKDFIHDKDAPADKVRKYIELTKK